MATAAFVIPQIKNEPNKHYEKDSPDRVALSAAVEALKQRLPLQVPLVVGGQEIRDTETKQEQLDPSQHARVVAQSSSATPHHVAAAIDAALAAKPAWQSMPFTSRAAIFLKAADLISSKYRFEIMAATMVGQGKNAWQAEIDAAAELVDFLRFNVQYAEKLYGEQPVHHSPGIWNRLEYRPLEGFVYAVTPFNFTAIAANLPTAPALMGNVVIWKPSPLALASNWILYNILLEAGLPRNVIQFVPGDAEQVTKVILSHRKFGALHFTGSTAVFRSLYGTIANGIANSTYIGYPRVVGETGGKNFHLIHPSASLENAVINTVRAAFEYQGQKCSACSRAYVPSSLWSEFKEQISTRVKSLKMGDPASYQNFIGPVISRASFDKLRKVIDEAKNDSELELVAGGSYDDSTGFYIHPTVYKTTNISHPLLSRELFGPVLVVYVWDDGEDVAAAYADICRRIDATTEYALTGAVFAQDREACLFAEDMLSESAGNFYVNVKCTGAVVGQQPFGGARASGTNDKAGSASLLGRFVSIRSIKEQFYEDGKVEYPSNVV